MREQSCLSCAGAVDSQGTSQNSLQRAKRKAREGAAGGGRGKRPAVMPEDVLMSQMGCSQQVIPHKHTWSCIKCCGQLIYISASLLSIAQVGMQHNVRITTICCFTHLSRDCLLFTDFVHNCHDLPVI